MTLPVISGVARCTFNWIETASSEAHVVSVQHFSGVFPGAELDFASALNSALQTHQLEGLADVTLVETIDIMCLDGVSGSVTSPLPAWHGSSGDGEPLPGFNILVNGQTGLRGSAHRGRWFLPSPLEFVVENGIIVEANRLEIQAAWSEFITALETAGYNWGVATYDAAHGGAGADFNDYISATVPAMPGIIKRRRNTGA